MRYQTLGVIALMALGAGVYGVAEANHSWGNYHWARSANQLALKLGDNVNSTWDGYLRTASSDWSVSAVLDTTVVAGNTNNTKGRNTPKTCTPTAGRVEVCDAKYGLNGWLGIASIWAVGDHITQGTVKLNDTYYAYPAYNTPVWRATVMCQEIGHMFGLDHQDENFSNVPLGTCMDYSNDSTLNQHPNAHDYEQLETIYAHLDSPQSTPALTPSQQHAVDHNDVTTWGKEVRSSEDRRTSVFERDFGHGQKVFTFVTWAN